MKRRLLILFVICSLFSLMSLVMSCSDGNKTSDNLMSGMQGPEIMFGEDYNKIVENQFYYTNYQQASYFSMDSFTASYANLRRYINNNQALSGDIIKTDELINYFSYDLEKPEDGEDFKISAEMSNAPWNQQHKVLTIGVTTKEEELANDVGNNIVFLIDSSGSMNSTNKIGLLKESFQMLLETLSPTDRISIVTYASGVNVHAKGVYADEKAYLQSIIDNLRASGGTYGSGGIQVAYELAERYFIPGGNNRVILATDGDFNIGISNQNELQKFITEKASTGVYLTVLGYGMGNYKDTTMETLAKNGNGGYAYIDCLLEAKKVLVDEINQTLVTVAKDVKNKVEFNPNVVESYRLIGYENKQLTEDEFENEETDAGEVGSGHTTLVTYEIVLKEDAVVGEEAFNVQINYKDPKSDVSKTTKSAFTLTSLNKNVTEDHLFALCLVEFSLILRNSKYRGTASYLGLISRLNQLNCVKNDEFKSEFLTLVEKAYRNNLLAHPSYNPNLITITICTEYGFNQLVCEKGTFISNEYLLNLIFNNNIPSDKQYELAYDEDFINHYVGSYAYDNMVVYIREVYLG